MKNKTQKVNIASRTSAEAASSPTPTLHLKSFKCSVAFAINTVNGTDRVGRDVTSGRVIYDVISGHVIDDVTSCMTSLPMFHRHHHHSSSSSSSSSKKHQRSELSTRVDGAGYKKSAPFGFERSQQRVALAAQAAAGTEVANREVPTAAWYFFWRGQINIREVYNHETVEHHSIMIKSRVSSMGRAS